MQDYKQSAQDLVNEIGRAKQLTDNTSIHDVFMSAENIVGLLAYLIKPLADIEQQYRREIVVDMEAGDSHAKAEAKGKASDTYKEWQKLKNLIELGNQQIMLLKRFRDDLNREYTRN